MSHRVINSKPSSLSSSSFITVPCQDIKKRNIVAVIQEKNANLITPLKEKKRRKGHVILPWTHHL
jgi:hypothetical protein